MPPLPSWQSARDTVHLWSQVIGKTRLATTPPMNHFWHVALYLTAHGLTTSPMTSDGVTFEVDFDFAKHELVVRTADGRQRTMPLAPQTVADFYHGYMSLLQDLGIGVRIWPRPVEVEEAIPFADDRRHASYDADALNRYWQAMTRAERVMQTFRGRFLGKASPIHFFWGAFDLAHTRFSGRTAPRHPGGAPNVGDWVMVESYSHEVSSCGFWGGGGPVQEAAFYAYAYPEPPGYSDARVMPEGAYYDRDLREFILPYEKVRASSSPDETLLAFLQSTYEAAADLAKWDRGALDRHVDVDAGSAP